MNPLGCGFSSSGPVNEPLFPAVERLKAEHIPLRQSMEEFHTEARTMLGKPEEGSSLADLREKISRFSDELEAHSEKEEGNLFPMMGKHIGTQVGPIAVMEYEHEQAKKYLSSFLNQTEKPPSSVEDVLKLAVEAYTVLDSHFTKEEQVLFPMANRILSTDEKDELNQKIK